MTGPKTKPEEVKTDPGEEAIRLLAAIVAGLQAPMSLGGPQMLGVAYKPLVTLRDALGLMGWHDAAAAERALLRVLKSRGRRGAPSSRGAG